MHGNITRHLNSLIGARVKCNIPGVLQDMISTTVTRRAYNVTVLTEQQHRDYNQAASEVLRQNALDEISSALTFNLFKLLNFGILLLLVSRTSHFNNYLQGRQLFMYCLVFV